MSAVCRNSDESSPFQKSFARSCKWDLGRRSNAEGGVPMIVNNAKFFEGEDLVMILQVALKR